MNDKPNYGPRGRKPRDTHDAFELFKSFLPKGTVALLRKFSTEKKLPMSRLVAIAVDNEISESVSPFNYACPMPTSPFIEYAYADEAARVFRFLQGFPAGTTIDTIVLCRRDIGVESKDEVMLAIRELIEKNLIERFVPLRKTGYRPDEERVRIIGAEPELMRKHRYKRVEGVSQKGVRTITDQDVQRDEE